MKNHFTQYKRNVSSQWGEDGIIEEIIKRIGTTSHKHCVEFGAGNGTELSNVWNLISNHSWSATLIESNPDSCKKWEEIKKPHGKRITLVNEWVTLEKGKTLDDILAAHKAPTELDLLSIDIDSNDYHIFKSIQKLKPRLILLEHNPTIPPHIDVFQAYNEEPPFGSSFAANVRLAHEKGYKLVTATVTNGFYVRADLFPKLGIEEPTPQDVFDDEAVTYVVSSYNGALYLFGRQTMPSYAKLFAASNFALTKRSIHSIVLGAGHATRQFSHSLLVKGRAVKMLIDGPGHTTGIIGIMPNIYRNFFKPYVKRIIRRK